MTQEPWLWIGFNAFIVYSSSAYAILGLRALHFALSGVMRMFHHLHYGLSAILAVSIWASLRWSPKGGYAAPAAPAASAVRPEIADGAESPR